MIGRKLIVIANQKRVFSSLKVAVAWDQVKMEDQGWRRQVRRHAPQRSNGDAPSATSPRSGSSNIGLSAPTIASSNKAKLRSGETRQVAQEPPPSRWKEMRQAVRIKATLESEGRRPSNARIADLCEEDREKVAKLIRRIVEVGAMHEDSEAEFQRQRTVMETEINELRSDAKRDAREIEELTEKLKSALTKLRDYQERVLVLEESSEVEVKHRLETDQTVDLLKVEVGKLRKLVKKQRDESEKRETEQQEKHRVEIERLASELKEAQEQLLLERKDRLLEKQRLLEERIERSAMLHGEKADTAESTVPREVNRYDEPHGHRTTPADASSFFSQSEGLPDQVKDMIAEWKSRMEHALTSTAATIAQERPVRVVSTACQTDSRRLEDPRLPGPQEPASMLERPALVSDWKQRSFDPLLTSTPSPVPASDRTGRHAHDTTVTRALIDDFGQPSVLAGDSFDDEVASSIALMNELGGSPDQGSRDCRKAATASTPPRNLSLYESSLLDVLDTIETPSRQVASSTDRRRLLQETSADSPTTRVLELMEGMRAREEKLARVKTTSPRDLSINEDMELISQFYERQTPFRP